MLDFALCFLALATVGVQDAAPKEGMAKLSFLVGSWTSEEEARRPGRDPVKFTLKGKNEWAMGGAAIRIEETFDLPGIGTRHNLIVITYDANEKSYFAWWFQNMGARPLEFKGQWNEKGALVFVSEPDAKRAGPELRVTYAPKSATEMDATLEIKGENDFEVRTVAKYRKS